MAHTSRRAILAVRVKYTQQAHCSIDRSFVLFQEANLRDGEQHGQRHDPKQLEADPEFGGRIAPDHLIEDGENDEKACPSESQHTPTFFREPERLSKQVFKPGFSECETAKQKDRKQRIYDCRLHFYEQIVLQPERQSAEHDYKKSRHQWHGRDRSVHQFRRHKRRYRSNDEAAGAPVNASLSVHDKKDQQRTKL